MKRVIAGNWKMNLSGAQAAALMQDLSTFLEEKASPDVACVICPPFPYITVAREAAAQNRVTIGAQDCSDQDQGAFTGQVAASMLKDVGCEYVILGHSERREYNNETSKLVKAKAQKALENGLTPIICVGETLVQRQGEQEEMIIAEQLEGSVPLIKESEMLIIAYEPVWAIGTGEVASISDIAKMHAFIKMKLQELLPGKDVLILYGGSVNAENASDILAVPNVGGALVGGASLKSESFSAIMQAALDL